VHDVGLLSHTRAGKDGARPLFSLATAPTTTTATSTSVRTPPRSRVERRGHASPARRASHHATATSNLLATAAPRVNQHTTAMEDAPRGDAETMALMDVRFEARRLEALLGTVTAELHACRRRHRIELDAARAELTQRQREHGEQAAAASAASEATIAEARRQCRQELTAELERVEAEVLDAYATELGVPAAKALEGPTTESGRATALLRRTVSIQSKQIANLHKQLAEAKELALRQSTPGSMPVMPALVDHGVHPNSCAIPCSNTSMPPNAPASTADAISAAVAARTEELSMHWKAQVEALRLALGRAKQQQQQSSASLQGAAGKDCTESQPEPSILIRQNAMLRRAADFLRRRHREMLLDPKAWMERSAFPGPDDANATHTALLLAKEIDATSATDDETDDQLNALNNANNIEERAASLMALLQQGVLRGDLSSPSAFSGFWQLVSALCIEERRRRMITLHLRELKRRSSAEGREQAASLAEERMRAHRAELALQNAVSQERSLASRAQAEMRVSLALASARAEELHYAHQAAEARYGEASRSLQASHSSGWRAFQRKLTALETEVRRLRTRETMWAQLCERQRVLAGALRSEGTQASAVAQMEAEVAAWEQSVLGPTATLDDPLAGAQAAASVEDAAPGGEAEVLQRVDEATAALSAEVLTLRSELVVARSRQVELAEGSARVAAECEAAKEQLAHANKRCETLHRTAQQGLQRLHALEVHVAVRLEATCGAADSADNLQLVRQLQADEDALRSRLASFEAESLPSARPTIIYVDEGIEDDEVEEDEEEEEVLMPSRQGSSRSTVAAIYVDEGVADDDGDASALDGFDTSDELRPSRQRSALPTVDPDSEQTMLLNGVPLVNGPHALMVEAADALREVCCSVIVAGVPRLIKLEVCDADTPSSLALELMDELQLSHSNDATLRDIVDQIEEALASAAPASAAFPG